MARRHPIFGFLDDRDAVDLFEWFSDRKDVAFLWHAKGRKVRNELKLSRAIELMSRRDTKYDKEIDQLAKGMEWQAYEELSPQGGGEYLIWHMPSGPITRTGNSDFEFTEVEDPFSGWVTSSTTGCHNMPWTGDEPRYIRIQLESNDPRNPDLVGHTYVSICGDDRQAATREMKHLWKNFKDFFKQRSACVLGNGVNSLEDESYLAWPGALETINRQRQDG